MFGRARPHRALIALIVILTLAVGAGCGALFVRAPAVSGASDAALRVIGYQPLTWDPARVGDSGSASVVAQVFEGLTTLDPDNKVQPALAESWTVSADGRQVDFKLRPSLHYSDGSPIAAQDVVDSWFRLLDPQHLSPLVSLLSDVVGVADYTGGRADREAVGLHAQSDHVLVDLARPATYFVAVTSSPSLAVVPAVVRERLDFQQLPPGMVASGGYVATAQSDTSITLEANGNYWAGRPAISPIELILDTQGENPIDMFEAGDLDYTVIGAFDAAWIRYDRDLGPQLRSTADLSLTYYGFDTTRAPFNDPLVRRAFAEAVDWDRIVGLAGGQPARSMVPPGIAGGAGEFRPAHDPDGARALLAQAGFPGGANFPQIALVSNGLGYEVAVATELEQVLGITVTVELVDFTEQQARAATGDRALLWDQTWVADYPHAHDYLGLLLETGSASNEGRWSDTAYDTEIAAAAATDDPTEQQAHYAAAQAILRDQVPVIPIEAAGGFALSREGLLGALPSGAGYLRLAGMAWAAGSGR